MIGQGINHTGSATSWWQAIQDKLHVERIVALVQGSKEHILEIGLYAGFGFLTGFFVKKFSTLFIMLLVFIGALVVLQQFNLIGIVVNWQAMYDLFGLQQAPVVDDNILVVVWAYIKTNWVITLSYAIGFLIGLKLA